MDRINRIAIPIMMLLLVGALVIEGFAGLHRRNAICDSQNKTLSVLHDVIVIATTPPKGAKLTAQQATNIARFQATTFARISAARC